MRITCPECKGKKKHLVFNCIANKNFEYDCDDCKGTGEIEVMTVGELIDKLSSIPHETKILTVGADFGGYDIEYHHSFGVGNIIENGSKKFPEKWWGWICIGGNEGHF